MQGAGGHALQHEPASQQGWMRATPRCRPLHVGSAATRSRGFGAVSGVAAFSCVLATVSRRVPCRWGQSGVLPSWCVEELAPRLQAARSVRNIRPAFEACLERGDMVTPQHGGLPSAVWTMAFARSSLLGAGADAGSSFVIAMCGVQRAPRQAHRMNLQEMTDAACVHGIEGLFWVSLPATAPTSVPHVPTADGRTTWRCVD